MRRTDNVDTDALLIRTILSSNCAALDAGFRIFRNFHLFPTRNSVISGIAWKCGGKSVNLHIYIVKGVKNMQNQMTESTKRKLAEYIGNAYMRSRKRMDVMLNTGGVEENPRQYHTDADLVYLVDRALQDCSKDTRKIIRNEYLQKADAYWYEEFYSRSTYYRLKRYAVNEFLKSLDI